MKKETQNPVNPTTMITPLFYLIILITSQIISAAGQAYTPTEHILLNCGAATRLNSSDGQSWDGDAATKLSPDISTPGLSSPATTEQDSSITSQVPYLSARIIHSKFSYIFPLSSGQKILRLYFYPATYTSNTTTGGQSFDKTQSFFGVTANQYTLLTNFSASLTVVKEFIINVRKTQALNVTFLPSPNSYAFINGIEVVSVPADFYMGSHNILKNNPLTYVNFPNTPYSVDENVTAFETVYRVNVGGETITGEGDTGMFRDWLQDDNFLASGIGNPLSNDTMPLTYSAPQTPNYSAPAIVYQTSRAMGTMAKQTPPVNLTWSFEVDTGFFYLLRLHFCEFMPGIFFKEGPPKIFTIFIDNRTAVEDADIIFFAGGTGIPVFRDYVVSVGNPTGEKSKYNLFLALAPARQIGSIYLDASLNGVEIFKLSTTTGNLAGVNPDLPQNTGRSSPNLQQPGWKKKKSSIGMIAGIIGGVAGAAAVVFLLILFIGRRRRGTKGFDGKRATKSSWAQLSPQSNSKLTAGSSGSSSLPSDLCLRFLLEEIKTATSDFDPALVIGTGGFGKVYKGYLDNSLTAVAIKRLDTNSRQGASEFRTEIEMLSNLRHVHLVSLIGYCNENKEMILVYDYMSNGTLRDHLYRTENPLNWKSRLQVAVGAARGLNYLHSGAKHSIIHRDVKSTNILLDEKYVAKVSDFGLSKLGPTGGDRSHISTVVKGSFGYIDPEYYKKQQLTEKSDVYSFGVVLFEVLCSRPAIVATLSRDQANLAEWARRCNKKGTIDQMVDPKLRGQIGPECLKSYSDIAISCLKEQGSDRPAMSDVVWSLEFALQLQEAADKDGSNREHLIVFAPFSPETDGTTISIGDDDTATLTGR